MMFKARCIALITVLLLAQITRAQDKKAPFKVMSFTAQDWATEASPGKTGTTFTVKLKILTSKPVTFKKLWIGKEYAPFEVQTYFKDPYKKPAKGDSVLLVYVKMLTPHKDTAVNEPPPFDYKGGALIGYETTGKTSYFVVKQFYLPVKRETRYTIKAPKEY
jgi:hypothetical protein